MNLAVAELAGERALRCQVAGGNGEDGEDGDGEDEVARLVEMLLWTAESGDADVAVSIQGQL